MISGKGRKKKKTEGRTAYLPRSNRPTRGGKGEGYWERGKKHSGAFSPSPVNLGGIRTLRRAYSAGPTRGEKKEKKREKQRGRGKRRRISLLPATWLDAGRGGRRGGDEVSRKEKCTEDWFLRLVKGRRETRSEKKKKTPPSNTTC